MIIPLFGGFEQAENSLERSQINSQKTLISGCRFVQNIAPLSLSRDRRINMEQKQTVKIEGNVGIDSI